MCAGRRGIEAYGLFDHVPAAPVEGTSRLLVHDWLFNFTHLLCPAPQVLPVLRDKHDEGLLKELLHRWNNHKVLGGWGG